MPVAIFTVVLIPGEDGRVHLETLGVVFGFAFKEGHILVAWHVEGPSFNSQHLELVLRWRVMQVS